MRTSTLADLPTRAFWGKLGRGSLYFFHLSREKKLTYEDGAFAGMFIFDDWKLAS